MLGYTTNPMESKSRGRRNGLRGTQTSSRNTAAHAGISRTRDHCSPSIAAAGPDADHPPPAANPHASAARFRSAGERGRL